MSTDAELLEGARNAVRICMGVQARDRVFILTDNDTATVGEALLQEALSTKAIVECMRLEDVSTRPCSELPQAVIDRIVSFLPSVTYLAVSAKPGEVTMRGQFIDAALERAGARHAHMPTVTPAIMREGMRVDYMYVNTLTRAVHDILRKASHIHVKSSRGSDIHGHFSGTYKWTPLGGLYHNPREWGNLPEGEVFTCPDSVDGILAADVVGDYFASKYGVLQDPVTMVFENGYVRDVTCPNRDLQEELAIYLDSKENGRRVGEFAIGTNIGVKGLRGNVIQDEKIPGLHIGVGYPFGSLTCADWDCDIHVDLVPSACTVVVDGEVLMEGGRFTIEV